MGNEPDFSPDALVDELMAKLEVMTSGGPMVNVRALEQVLPQQPFASRQPYPFPQGELSRYLAAELKAYLEAPLPQSVQELRQGLSHAAVQSWQSHMSGADEEYHPPEEIPFPVDVVADITQQDVDTIHQAANIEAAPLGFDAFNPLCYGWLAMRYFSVNLACSWPEGPPPLDLCGLPSTTGHKPLPPDSVVTVNELLKSYSADGIRTPALFFLCSYAALMQSSRDEIRESRDLARDELELCITRARRIQDVVRDLLAIVPQPRPHRFMRAHRARGLLSAPSSYLRLAATREIEELLQLDPKRESFQQLLLDKRESLQRFLDRVDGIIEQAQKMAEEQEAALISHGVVQRSKHLEVVRRCALAVLKVLDEGRSQKGRRPRKKALQLLDLWGVSISESLFNMWIRRAA